MADEQRKDAQAPSQPGFSGLSGLIKEAFFSVNPEKIAYNAMDHVIIPGFKNLINDLVHEIVGSWLWKDGGPSRRDGRYRDYSRYSSSSFSSSRSSDAPVREDEGLRNNGLVSYKYIPIRDGDDKRAYDDATKLKYDILDWLEEYGDLTVDRFCKIANITTDWAKTSYGWTRNDVRTEDITIHRVSGGYEVSLPKPRELNR